MKNIYCHSSLSERIFALGILVCLAVFPAGQAFAATRTWIGGDSPWDASALKWSPADEPDADDEAVFNTADTVDLANASEAVQALTMSGGIDLDLNGNDLTVDIGAMVMGGSGTTLRIPQGSILNTDDIVVDDSSQVFLTGGEIMMTEGGGEAVLYIGGTAKVSGYGTIRNEDIINSPNTVVMISYGELRATTFDLLGTDSGTLTITVNDSDGRINIDQTGSSVFIGRNDTLDINGEAHGIEGFSGEMTFYSGSTLDMSNPWTLDGGTIEANTHGVIAGTAGPAATIAGAAFTQTGGTITLPDQYDSLQFSAVYDGQGGAIVNHGRVIFDAVSTVDTGVDFQMNGEYASITLNPGVQATIRDADFNADGADTSTNIITIGDDALLFLDLGPGADEGLSGPVFLDGGRLDVRTVDSDWSLDGAGSLEARTSAFTSVVRGNSVDVQKPVIVHAGAILQFDASSTWDPQAAVDLVAGSQLTLEGTCYFNGGTFSGEGLLEMGGNSVFQAATTLDVSSIQFTSDSFEHNIHTILEGVTVTMNVDSIGPGGAMAEELRLMGDGAALIVNGPASWKKTGEDLLTSPFSSGKTTLGGSSRFVLEARLTGNDDIDLTAPVTFSSLGIVDVSGTVLLAGGEALIEYGADVTCGILRNATANLLTVEDETIINGLLENNGLLEIDAAPGQLHGTNFQQSAGGTLRMQIQGTQLNQDYDRMILSGTGLLAGTLEVSLTGGFSPVLGDTFPIIVTSGGRTGEFDAVDFTAADPGPGLEWDVLYSSTGVSLKVVAASPFENWIDSFPELTDPADKTKTADPDGDGIDNWGEFALDGHPASGDSGGKIVGKMATYGGEEVWTLTFPVRDGLTYSLSDPPGGEVVLQQITDRVVYTIRATHDLSDFSLDVGELIGPEEAAIQAGLPSLHPGWHYSTFSRPAPLAGGPGEYLHVEVSEM
ncbi:MAG: hypothetical protein ACP5I4_03955 [Oceanipulchritudo sp.]